MVLFQQFFFFSAIFSHLRLELSYFLLQTFYLGAKVASFFINLNHLNPVHILRIFCTNYRLLLLLQLFFKLLNCLHEAFINILDPLKLNKVMSKPCMLIGKLLISMLLVLGFC
jgi:hypothetical protein